MGFEVGLGEGDGEGGVGGEVQAGVAFSPVFYYGDVDGGGGAGAVDCLVGGGHGGGGGEIPGRAGAVGCCGCTFICGRLSLNK